MRVLIVIAHQEPKSFCHALKDTAENILKAKGHVVDISDLYAMKFDPITDEYDIQDHQRPEFFKYQMETAAAFKEGKLVKDIVAEQEKVNNADLVLFCFPLYWFNMPAILKGWFDRVFTMGYAYGGGRLYSNGPFKGKKAALAFTTGGLGTLYSKSGINGDMEIILWPIQNGCLNFCGFEVLKPFVAYGPARKTQEERVKLLEEWGARLENIFEEEPLKFHPNEDFGPTMELPLDTEVTTIGQHCGKPLPSGQMGL